MAPQPTFVQRVVDRISLPSGTTISVSPSAQTTVGNTLVAVFKFSSGTDISSITDTQGNAWRRDFNPNATQSNPPIWSCYLATALGTTDTITVNLTATSANNDCRINEYNGISSTDWLDTAVTATITKTNVTTVTLTAGATSVDNEIVVTNLSSGTTTTWGASAGWNNVATASGHSSVADQPAASAGTILSVTWTAGVSAGNITANIVGYKPPLTSTDNLAGTDAGTSSGTASLSDQHADTLGIVDHGMSTGAASPTKTGAYTPTSRMLARQTLGVELRNTEMGNGRLFVLNASQTIAGQLAFGPRRETYDLREAASDGGVATQDLHLATALRATGLFTESAL